MGRGSRAIKRWAKDRQRKKKARDKKGAPTTATGATKAPAKKKS